MLQDPWAAAGPWHTRTTGTAGVEGAGGTGGLAAAAVGDGKAWPGFEIDHSEPSGSRVAISRAGRRPRPHEAARPHGRAIRRPEHQRVMSA